MTWPLSNLQVTDIDSGTDDPVVSRSVLAGAAIGFNHIRKHISEFMTRVIGCSTEAQARELLNLSAAGFMARDSRVVPTGVSRFQEYTYVDYSDGLFNASTGEYLVQETGVYVVSYGVLLVPPSQIFSSDMRLTVNGIGLAGSRMVLASHSASTVNTIQMDRTTALYLARGDTINTDMYTYGGGNVTQAHWFSANLVGG